MSQNTQECKIQPRDSRWLSVSCNQPAVRVNFTQFVMNFTQFVMNFTQFVGAGSHYNPQDVFLYKFDSPGNFTGSCISQSWSGIRTESVE